MNIIYISKNKYKFDESKRLFDAELKKLKEKGENLDINLIRMEGDSIDEIQTEDVDKLIKDKLLKAYKIYKRPVLIEHTILNIERLNGYPNAQTSGFWDTLTKKDENPGELLCEIVDKLSGDNNAIAKTIYCYCDGKNVIKGEGEVAGFISKEPKGNSEFQWDVIFIPSDKAADNKTFAELEESYTENKKDLFSMRAKAMKNFISKFKEIYNDVDYNIGLNSEYIKDIANKIIDKKLVLFVGSGLSASINMPSWQGLMRNLGERIGFKDTEIFLALGENLELAEYYSSENDDKIEDLVELLMSKKSIVDIEKYIKISKTHKILANLNVDTIYTTNYEDLIERAFNIHNKGRKYSTIYDLETLNEYNVGDVEIIKLHGDLKKPEDIVLTQTSYYKRYDFENCLDIKLRNDLLTKSVLFIGYSFSDPNIKYMMHKLNSIWEGKNCAHRPKSYIFLTENNPVQRRIIEKNNNMITIVTENLNKTKALEEFLITVKEHVEGIKK